MTAQTVRRRHVFFLSGFDPKGASYYYRLYASGAAAQSLTSGHTYEVGARQRTPDPHVQQWDTMWRGSATAPGGPVSSTLEFLAWDDLVRAQWPRGVAEVVWGSLRAYATALSSGAGLIRVWQQSRRTLVALAYPALLWLLAFSLGLLLAWLVVRGVNTAASVAWPLAALVCGGVWWGALRLERKLHTSWLLRIYRFAALWAGGRLPGLEDRLDNMAARVHQRLQNHDADEVLVVGYSVGSLLATSVMARVLRKCEFDPAAVGRLSFLTLGQCIPLLGLMPPARQFRQELTVLAGADNLCWVDYSSPTDWGSFALVDPLKICRVAPAAGASLVPSMRSPRFHTLFDAEDYVQFRRNKRGLHLQYLMASPKPGEYDYFLMTAGPWRLGQGRTT